jgi:hypothetical protein
MTKKDNMLNQFQDLEFDKSLLYLISDSPNLQSCVAVANDTAKSHEPYLPWKSRHSAMYWALPPEERTKINDQTERIFQNVRGPTPKLNPKNPNHMPNVRIWLKTRDCITFSYYLENRGTSGKNIPSFESIFNDYRGKIRDTFSEYNDAFVQAELNFKSQFPHDVGISDVLKKNYIEYIGELIHTVSEVLAETFHSPAASAIGGTVKLFTKIMNDLKDEREKMETIIRDRNLTETFATIRDKGKAVLSKLETSFAEEKPELERYYNGLSIQEKLDYDFRAFVAKPIKTSLEFETEYYLDLINNLEGYLEINISFQLADISPIGQPKDPTQPFFLSGIRIDKVKTVAQGYAQYIASGLSRLKTSLAGIKPINEDLGNIFEWPVRKRIIITYRPFPLGLPPRTFKRHITKGFRKDADRDPYNFILSDQTLTPQDQKVWESMIKPGSEEKFVHIYLRDYVQKAFDLNQNTHLIIG